MWLDKKTFLTNDLTKGLLVKEKSNFHTWKINRASYPHFQRLEKLIRFRKAGTIAAEKLLVELPFAFEEMLAASGNSHAVEQVGVIKQE